jgi:hypothetical protein
MAQQKSSNPFYILLVLAGIAFFITASAYGVMTVKGLYPEGTGTDMGTGPIGLGDGQGTLDQSSLMDWLDKNGFQLLMCELGVLAIFTFAGIGTDSYWSGRKPNPLADRSLAATEKQSSVRNR